MGVVVTASTVSNSSVGNVEFFILKLLGDNSVNSGYNMDPRALLSCPMSIC